MKNFKYTINGNVYDVVINKVEDTFADVQVNGTSYKVEIEKPARKPIASIQHPDPIITPIARPQQSASPDSGIIRSPLPGVILDIACKVGDTVKKGQKLMILEAMKMENAINSSKDGVIAEIKASKGDSVLEGADLIVIS